MLKPVYIVSSNVISALGFTAADNSNAIKAGKSGVKKTVVKAANNLEVPLSLVDTDTLTQAFSKYDDAAKYTRLEQLMICSIMDAYQQADFVGFTNPRTLVIISTTKGNIDMLATQLYPGIDGSRLYLASMAKAVGDFFGYHSTPMVVSNACISGVQAIVMASRFIRQGLYDHAIVCGGDIIDGFTVSGFQSFKALSNEPCKPFDANRTGLNLGEAIGTVILSKEKSGIEVLGGAISNDANHISGPSRDGSGLKLAINKAIAESEVNAAEIDFVSAHGTATPYNDEMEALAFNGCGLNAPVNSLKGYFGHTLGGAGIVESIMTAQMLQAQTIVKSLGFEKLGVTAPINIATETKPLVINHALKTASGFGGCNAALILKKG